MAGTALFVYGTLTDEGLVVVLTGRRFVRRPARLEGYERVVPARGYPYVVPRAGRHVEGFLVEDVDAASLRRLDTYEDEGRLYLRRPADLRGLRRPRRSHRSASARARPRTASSIGRVSRRVNVFCWLGWYEQSNARPDGRRYSAPCAKRGAGRGTSTPRALSAASRPSCATLPRTTATRSRGKSASSPRSQRRQAAISPAVGRLAGGAQRATAVTKAPRSTSPSSRAVDVGWLARPARWRAA